jgi:hypothetical protein
MPADVQRDMHWSAVSFLTKVWPVIGPMIGGGTVELVESTAPDALRAALDIRADIDAWQLCDVNGLMRGIASRVQRVLEPYPTFTSRSLRTTGTDTELVKRMRVVTSPDKGWLYPTLTVQAYERKQTGVLLTAAVTHTLPMYRAVLDDFTRPRGQRLVYTQRNPQDGNLFLVVPWELLKREAVPLLVWPKDAIDLPMPDDHTPGVPLASWEADDPDFRAWEEQFISVLVSCVTCEQVLYERT